MHGNKEILKKKSNEKSNIKDILLYINFKIANYTIEISELFYKFYKKSFSKIAEEK